MKAQHPPHIPSNTLAVTEHFRSLRVAGKAAVAAARRWWHPGGHRLHSSLSTDGKSCRKKNEM